MIAAARLVCARPQSDVGPVLLLSSRELTVFFAVDWCRRLNTSQSVEAVLPARRSHLSHEGGTCMSRTTFWRAPALAGARKRRSAFRPRLEELEDRRVPASFRSYDGTGNNLAHPDWGSVNVDLLRLAPADYSDGIGSPAGAERPGARDVSNTIAAQTGDVLNDRNLSAMIYAFGQFLDHDLDLTTNASPAQPFNIPVPAGD